MKLRVIFNLNVRVGKPSLNAPCYQYLAPGSILEVDGNLYQGDKYDGIVTWYKDEASNYYWSGGVENVREIKDSYFAYNTKLKPAWMSGNFDVSSYWTKTTGKGITVAVIDSGIFPHDDLIDCIDSKYQKSFVGDSVVDTDGHGTHIAGIIAARGKSDLIGVAPDVKIVPIKVFNKENDIVDNESLANAIDYAASLSHIQIINLSLCANKNEANFEKLEFAIRNAIEKRGKIIVAAAGNNCGDFVNPPAIFENVFAISAVEKISIKSDEYIIPRIFNYGERVDTSCIGYEITSCNNFKNGITSKNGTSMATAYISGLIALKLQILIQQDGINLVRQAISDSIKTSIFKYAYRYNDNNKKLPIIDIKHFLNI